jgi:crotonobetainyl-CoA:carnitine CoA-transferase CaiB-like acyl-CoA transferase
MTVDGRLAGESTSALAGVRVLDLTRGCAGPLIGMTLADFGADVVKIEPPAGDFARAWPGFELWNRGKRCQRIDLRSLAGQRELAELAAAADVLVEDAVPGSAVSTALLRVSRDAGVIHCRLSAFGPAQRSGGVPGHEGVVAAESGLYLGIDELFGAASDTPRDRPIFTVAPTNSFAGAQLCLQGVLACLIATRRGRSFHLVESSLLQGALSVLMRRAFARVDPTSGRKPASGRPETVRRGIGLTFLTVQCADQRWLQMCARQDAHFLSWLRVIGLADAAAQPRYESGPMAIPTVEDIDELESLIRKAMSALPATEWLARFAEAGVGADPFLTPDEFLAHPHNVANGLVREWADRDEHGATGVTLGPLANLHGTPAVPPRRPVEGRPAWQGRRGIDTNPDDNPPAGPLAGLVVLEVAYFLAAPLATTILAELGARVIKVEPPRGDPWRRTGTEVAHILHGKESIEVDLKDPRGLALVHRLVARADALIQSFRPGVADRLGLGYDECRRINPRLVYALSTGYGSQGPLAKQPAFHSTPNAWSGGGILQGGAGNAPVDCSYPDPASGLVNATAVLLALYARERTGTGQYLETSMLLSGAHVLSNWYTPAGIDAFRPQDAGQHGMAAHYRLYECRSGWVFASLLTPRDWNEFSRVVGRPEWTVEDDLSGDRFAARTAAVESAVEHHLRQRDADDWVRDAAGRVPLVRADATTLERYLEDRGLLTPASHPDFGDYWKLPGKFIVDGRRPEPGDAPRVGEHTVRIARELGLPDDEIETLLAAHVLGDTPRARVATEGA